MYDLFVVIYDILLMVSLITFLIYVVVTWYKLRKENRSKPEEVKKFIASAPSLDKLDHRMKEVEELRDHYYELYCLSSYEGVNPLYGVYYELDTALKILREYLSKITR